MHFSLALPHEADLQEFSELIPLLEKIGISAAITKDNAIIGIEINYEKRKVEEILSRGAGRYRKYIDPESYRSVTEIRQRRQNGESMADIAKDLGVSRATLYRRLKEAKEDGDDFLAKSRI